MLEAVRRSGRMCGLGFQAIYSDSINFIKARIASGALGEVRRLRSWAFWPRPDRYYDRNDWAGRLKVGQAWVLDGPSNNALGHEIANMLYLASPRPGEFARPRAVRAELYHARDVSSEDTSAIEILTAEGPTAYFLTSHATGGAHTGPWIEVECTRARVQWQFDGKTTITYDDGRTESSGDAVRPAVAALANFTQAVRAGDASLLKCDLKMGRNFTLAINGAFESSGRVHLVPSRWVGRTGSGGDARLVIEGIDEAIARCGREGRLFSDIGVPWAVRTEPFDLAGYGNFPQRFCDE
jgi:predicted dehydrogenase